MDAAKESDDDLLDYNPFHKAKKRKVNNDKESSTATTAFRSPLGSQIALSLPPPPPTEEQISQAIECAAQKKVKLASVPNDISSPNQLFWHKKTSKGGYGRKSSTFFYPCRECHPDYATGLAIDSHWDSEVKALVQFIDGPKFDKSQLVLRKSLMPYYDGMGKSTKKDIEKSKDIGEDGEREQVHIYPDRWCQDTIEKQHKELRAKGRKKSARAKRSTHTDATNSPSFASTESVHVDEVEVQCRSMELYMHKVLKYAIQKGKKQRLKDLQEREKEHSEQNSHAQEQGLGLQSSSSQLQESLTTACVSQSQESVDMEDFLPSASSPPSSDGEYDFSLGIHKEKRKKERIRPGDIIEYYEPNGTFGDDRFHRKAKVISVNPKNRDFPLKLDNGGFLPRESQIKRVQIIMRGNLKDNSENATWNMIKDYTLQTAGIDTVTLGSNDDAGGIMANVKTFNSILEKNQSVFLQKSRDLVGDASDILTFSKETKGMSKGIDVSSKE